MIELYGNGVCITLPSAEDYDPPLYKKINCRNCGAPVKEYIQKCEFCGTKRKLKDYMTKEC